jgi:integrase
VPSLRERPPGSGHWEVTVSSGTGRERARRTFTVAGTAAAARAAGERAERALRAGRLAWPGQGTVKDLLVRWLAEDVARRVTSPAGLVSYRRVAALYAAPLHAVPLARLRPSHLERLERAWLTVGGVRGRPLSPVTVRQYHYLLRGAFRWATTTRPPLLDANPLDAVAPPRADAPEFPVLSVEQARRLLAALEHESYGPLLRVALATGLRLSELRGLAWGDVDAASGRLFVRRQAQRVAGAEYVRPPKSRKPRVVDVGEAALDALDAQRRLAADWRRTAGDGWAGGDHVFPDPATGGRFKPDAVRDALAAALARSGCPRLRLHDLRHAWATLLLAHGTSPKVVQAAAGHASPAYLLARYGHVLEGEGQRAARRLDGLLLPGQHKSRHRESASGDGGDLPPGAGSDR